MASAQQFSQHDSPTVIVAGHDLPGSAAELVDLAIPNREMPRPNLTAREQEVLRCWITSDSKTVVSVALGLSDSTVKTHLHRIRGKYQAVGRHASTKAALVARALQDGLIRLEDL
ncbi:response regulator transcription factor [Tomitella biformata]|uniref:response regulator transcription factor n=1 Tax=Tomitella biformata TaxID=630403 RepID=UPI0004635B17|nr:LuxR C-terminal-related transcriptional regulator [Tomitella biformata]